MNNTQQLLEEIKTEISSLKIRVRGIEQYLLSLPNTDQYIQDRSDIEVGTLLEKAKKLVANYDRVSASLLQRQLMIGYARAARLLDELEEAGYLGPGEGVKPRKVLVTKNKAINV